MVRVVFTLLLLTELGSLFAQSRISGFITGYSGMPVPAALVTLKEGSNASASVKQTDSIGVFTFSDVGNDTCVLTISHVGYLPYELHFKLRRDTTLNIYLEQRIEQLKEVGVDGTKATIQRTVDKLVYNVSNSVTATGTDALQAIGQIPGVHVNNDEIRVAGRGQTRIMVNDRLIAMQGQDLIRYLKSFSANQISRMELITNPSARFDVEGNAGLINIITKRTRIQGYSGNLQLASKYYLPGVASMYGFSTFGEMSGSGNLAYNSSRWSAYLNFNLVRDRHLEGFQFDVFYPRQHWLQTDTGLYTHEGYTALLGVDYKISSSVTIGVSYSGGWDMYDGSDHVRNPIYNREGALDSLLLTYADYHPIAQPAVWNFYTDIKLDSTGRQLSINADYFNYYRNDVSDFETNSYDADGNEKPGSQVRIFDRNKQNISIYTVKADIDFPTPFATYLFGSKLSFITNYSNAFYYNKTDAGDLVYNSNLSNEFDYRENTQAIYGSMSKEMKRWKLQAGVRGELTQTKGYSYTLQKTTFNKYFRLFPSFLVSYASDASNTFSLSFGKRVNRPSFWSLNPFRSLYTAYSYGEGNPYLQPEYNSNLALAHSFKNFLRTELFANRTQNGFVNVTIVDPDTNFVYTTPLNFIRTTRAGVSESASFKPFQWWESTALATIYYTLAHSSLSYIKSLEGLGSYFSSTNNFYFNQSKTFAAAVNFWAQFPEVDHIGKTEGYYKLDIGAKITSANKKWDAGLNVSDVFRSSALRYSYTVNGVSQRFANFQIFRFVNLSVSYRFGSGSASSNKRGPGNEEERGRVH